MLHNNMETLLASNLKAHVSIFYSVKKSDDWILLSEVTSILSLQICNSNIYQIFQGVHHAL